MLPQTVVTAILLATGFALLVGGAVASDLVSELPYEHAATLALVGAVSACAAALMAALVGTRMPTSALLIWSLWLLVMTGPRAVTAVLALALAAVGLGALLVRDESAASPGLRLAAGLALIAAVVGWTLPLEIHHRAVYALSLVTILYFRRRAIGRSLRTLWRSWNNAIESNPVLATSVVHISGLSVATLWLPNLLYDDLAYHLGMPTQLQHLGYYRMDAGSQVWALAPWAVDVLRSIPRVIADAPVRDAFAANVVAPTAYLTPKRAPDSCGFHAAASLAGPVRRGP